MYSITGFVYVLLFAKEKAQNFTSARNRLLAVIKYCLNTCVDL
jgi:hypothetical protein